MNCRPLHDRLVVRRLEDGEQIVGGIIIPDSAKEKPQRGTVIAVGSGTVKDDGTRSLDVLVTLVTPECADDEAPLRSTQHHVGTVVGNKTGEKIEQGFEHSFETEILSQRDIGIAQDLSLPPYGLFAGQ